MVWLLQKYKRTESRWLEEKLTIAIGLVVSLCREAISWVVLKRHECDGSHLVFHAAADKNRLEIYVVDNSRFKSKAKVCDTRQLKCTYPSVI